MIVDELVSQLCCDGATEVRTAASATCVTAMFVGNLVQAQRALPVKMKIASDSVAICDRLITKCSAPSGTGPDQVPSPEVPAKEQEDSQEAAFSRLCRQGQLAHSVVVDSADSESDWERLLHDEWNRSGSFQLNWPGLPAQQSLTVEVSTC